MSNPRTTILLVDDHHMVRHGLQLYLQSRDDLTVVGQAASSASALEQVRTHQPDVVIMDIHLSDESGIDVARKILEEFPDTKIIALSADGSLPLVNEALQAGVSAYLLKECDPQEMLRAIETVVDHRIYLPPAVNSEVVKSYLETLSHGGTPAKPTVTPRERELLKLVAEGRRNKEIAEIMGIGVRSVEVFRSRLMKKLNCGSAAELTRYAIREGIATP